MILCREYAAAVRRTPLLRGLPVAILPALLLAGCAQSSGGSGTDAAPGPVRIVATTDVWGDIASEVGGDAVEVTSLIDSPTADPHEYEATTQDQLAVTRADVAVMNGGGFDSFMDDLLANADDSITVVNAFDEAGLEGEGHSHEEEGEEHEHGEVNEHVWYDLHAAEHVAEAIATAVTDADPDAASTVKQNLAAFQDSIERLEAQEEQIRGTADGQGVAITEPVPLYMTEALGLVNRTPEAFSEAVEEGEDVPVSALNQELRLFTEGEVAVLALNVQTQDPTTDRVRKAAEDAGIPVVEVRETLPEGQGYLDWMRSDLDAFQEALAA
jgi:zinc/manganese transport system substrate-binding protein